jgi:hypothetical protein
MAIGKRLLSLIPPSVKGALRYTRGHHSDFYPFGFAMNGQTARLEAVRQIFYKCGIQSIIETGTFRGTTTEWLAGFGVPVTTVESYRPAFEFSVRRLRRRENVSIRFGTSVEVLREHLPTVGRDTPTMFYLDAHWEGHLPLAEELDTICATLTRFVIVVDDFEVPGDSGYSFDNYGPGKALTGGYLDACNGRHLSRFYPTVPSSEETGGRRGWIVLTSAPLFVAALSTIPLLQSGEGLKSAA